MTWALMERPARNRGRWGARSWACLDGGAGGGEEDSEGVDEVFGVAGLEAVAVGVVVAEGGDVVVGEGFGHVVHEGGAHGGAGAVAEDEEGDGVGGLEEEGGEVGAGGGRWGRWFGGVSWRSRRSRFQAAVTSTPEALSDGSECLVDLANVRSVVGVGELADGRLADAEAAGEFDLGDSLGAHGRVEGKLGRNDGWEPVRRAAQAGADRVSGMSRFW